MIAVINLKTCYDLLIARNFLMDYYGFTPDRANTTINSECRR